MNSEAKGSITRGTRSIIELMRTIPDKPVEASRPPAVSVQGVTFRYGANTVLKDLSLTIGAGERVAILGPNGSGKSTLLELMTGAYSAEQGSVQLHVPEVAFVPQRNSVSDAVPITVRETVRMGRWRDRGMFKRLTTRDHEIIDEQLERLGLTEVSSRRLSQLSGGQRQRALIGQALAQHAPLLLLDEPEAGLDAEAKSIIGEVIGEEVASGKTVVIATHDTETAGASERLILLRGHAGGIVADGPPEEVLTDAVLASAFAYRA